MDKNIFFDIKLTDDQVALFYLGQEGYLIKYHDIFILTDPYLSDYVDQNCCTETVKWVRNYPAPIKAEEMDFVDYVLCSHGHADHSDPYTLSAIAKANPDTIFIVPEPIKEDYLAYGIAPHRLIGALVDKSINLHGCNIIPVPSAHETLRQDDKGNYIDLGYKIFLDNISIYHAGDCCIYDGLAERIMDINILMTPVNGRSYYKLRDDIIGNMTAEEAVLLAKEVHADLLIPMHYDLYSINCINPAHFVDCLYTINPKQKFHMFVPSEYYIYNKEK